MKTQNVNIETGEVVIRDMTPEEIEAFQVLAQAEIQAMQQVVEKIATQINSQILLETLLEAFIPYLQQVMTGNPPVMTFDNFMRGVAEGYLQKTNI